MTSPNLMSFGKGSGCGCKMPPEALKTMLSGLLCNNSVENVVVGNDLSDDCSVYDLGNGQYLLQTVDFFTPMINDPFIFGSAAAANALSDIWAMGGKPIMANAVFSWPSELPIEMGREVLHGARDICRQAGVALAGGHTIDGREPLFGLSVTGLATPQTLKRNAGAQPGDVILLSKPLGVGMLAAAYKRGTADENQQIALQTTLVKLNNGGEQLGKLAAVHAMTDVTGFGLAGHLLEMMRAAGCGAEISEALLPKIPEALPLAASFVLPDNATRNWNAYEKELQMNNAAAFPWVADPQTNGGLLMAVGPDCVDSVLEMLPECSVIGTFTEKQKIPVLVIN
ncbi:MAG: selenide, water dikinase SelD [Sphingomonadales bacterium]|nr:selenide, water dikinase SelD [Sphingomonadales bacterium]